MARTAARRARRRLAVGFGVALLVVAELGLRLAGWGAREPFFVERVDGDGVAWWVTNPAVGDNWFRTPEWEDAVRRPRPQRFRAEKQGPRVFVLGESAVYGTPWADDGAWPALLGERLTGRDGAPVEVVNVGVRAVTLGVMPGIVAELRGYQPDALVLYAGNNEYYGVREPSLLADLRLYRLVAGPLAARLVLPDPRPGVKVGAPLPPGDPRHAEVLARAQSDLAAILAAAGPVPVLVVPPVGNERDLAPLGSVDAGPEVAALVKRAVEDPLPARAEVEAALGAHPDHAALHYLLGLAELAAAGVPPATPAALPGDPVTPGATPSALPGDPVIPGATRAAVPAPSRALAELQRAIDLDMLPVRPRSDLRAALAASPWVCDPEPALRAASPDGVLGWPVLVDHVHLGLPGGLVLADTVAACLAARADLPLAVAPASAGSPSSPAAGVPTSLASAALSPVDEAVGLRAVGRYVATSALASSPSAPVLLRRLSETIDALDGLLTAAERREVNAPPTSDIHVRLARDPARTLPELERAARTHAGDPAILRALAAARRAAGDDAGAHRAEAEAALWASLAP